MEKIKTLWNHLNGRIDRLWPEEERRRKEGKKEKLGERMGRFFYLHRLELLYVLLMGGFLFFLSWILPFNQGPDEEMRYLVPQYIYKHGTLPAGWDPEVRHELWGISYAFHPILPYVLGGWLMRLVGLFSDSQKALLMAARFANILIGMGFYWYVQRIAKKLFPRRMFRYFFIALLSMLPQLLYLFVYVNTDGIAIFSGAMIIYYWLVGMERKWDRGSCTGLAVGVAVCALSYFTAYGYALFSILLFVGTMAVFYRKKGFKICAGAILKRGIYITVLVFLLTGWWFVRTAVLYDGDFLGLYAPNKYGEMYAKEEFKPSNRESVQEQGISLEEMLKSEDEGGMDWMRTTWRSFIGYFGFLEHPLGLDIYEIHKKIFALGFLGIGLQAALALLYYIRAGTRRILKGATLGKAAWLQDKEEGAVLTRPSFAVDEGKIRGANFWILQISFGCCIIIPILLSLYYSYCDDFQPQGRYVMPLVVPLMYFVAAGIQRFVTLFFRKWFVYIMMIPLFYGILHVFLGAFVSVYIPTYVDALSAWEAVRFPWFSNQGWLMRVIHMLIPG